MIGLQEHAHVRPAFQEEGQFLRYLIADRIAGRGAATQKCHAQGSPSLDSLEKEAPMLALAPESSNAGISIPWKLAAPDPCRTIDGCEIISSSSAVPFPQARKKKWSFVSQSWKVPIAVRSSFSQSMTCFWWADPGVPIFGCRTIIFPVCIFSSK